MKKIEHMPTRLTFIVPLILLTGIGGAGAQQLGDVYAGPSSPPCGAATAT